MPIGNQQVRPTAAVNVSSSDLSSDRSILDIDTLEHKYNSRSPSSVPSHLLQKIQQHPVYIHTTSTPLPPPPLTQRVNQLIFSSL